eukprot:2695388-Rhodomonas_salina.1
MAEPKNERQARASSHAKEWLITEEIELKTIYKMGTFEIVEVHCGLRGAAARVQSNFTSKGSREESYGAGAIRPGSWFQDKTSPACPK